MSHRNPFAKLPKLLALFAIVTACDGLPNEPHDSGPPVALSFQASVASAPEVNVIAVEVTGSGIPVPIRGNFAVVDGRAEGTLQVPAGNGRVFTARGFDTPGAVTHEGSVTRDVRPSGPPVQIPLTPRGVGVPIVVTLGGYGITLEPQTAEVAVGATLVFSAIVRDADGNELPDAVLTWGASNPALATVDAAGVVTGLYPGTLRIVASFQGVAAQAELTVLEGAANQPPTASIAAPADGTVFVVGTAISFQGSADDPEEGALTGAALVWTSSLDGEIGTGESFNRSDLSLGEHTITLTATDAEGLTGNHSIGITVEPLPAIRWVVTGQDGTHSSHNGIDWTRTNAFVGRTVAHNGSQWLTASDQGGSTRRSSDGRTWLSSNSGLANAYGVAWLESAQRWVIAGTGIATSTTGATWTTHALPLEFAEDVACNADRCVAVGWGGTGIATSTDGTTWTATETPFTGTSIRVIVVAWNGSYWLAAARDQRGVVRSADGVTWSAVEGTGNISPYSLGYKDGTWMIGSLYNALWVSADEGMTWTNRGGPFHSAYPSQDQVVITGITSGEGQWLVVSRSREPNLQHVAISDDGVNWTRSLQRYYGFEAAAYGGP
jgi:hypothetical protein